MEPSIKKNSVQNLIRNPFSTLTHEEQMEIKQLGRPTPDLKGFVSKSKKCNKEYTRHFHADTYKNHTWLCGCEVEKAVFCFPCLCFGNTSSWTECGIKQLSHLSSKIKIHQNSFDHLQSEVNLKVLGNHYVNDEIDKLNEIEIIRHNEQIDKNRYILEIYLKCVQFCGAYNLSLQNQGNNNVMTSSNNNSVLLGAVELCKSSDVKLRCYFETSTSIDWTSMTIHDDLLDCIFLVARQIILSEIEKAQFISIIVDGTIDVSSTAHFVLLFRYELNGFPVERFWGFFNATNGYNVVSLTQTILSEINSIVKDASYKLVAQSYGGTAIISKVNIGVKELYPYAHYMHCHSHHLHVEMTQAVSMNKEVQIFFSDLSGITDFFSNSPQKVTVLDGLINNQSSQSKCDFTGTGGTLKTVYLYRSEIMHCMDIVIDTLQQTSTINQAKSIKRLLSDSVFVVWLSVFYEIMPNVQSFHNSVKTAAIEDSVNECLSILVQQFEKQISEIRNKVTNIIEIASNLPDVNVKIKRHDEQCNNLNYNNEARKQLAIEICNTLVDTTKDRLEFTNHLTIVKLFQAEKYSAYSKKFPIQLFQCMFHCYPFFDKDRLKTELQVIYYRDDFRNLSGIIPTYRYILKNDMIGTFKEVILLLRLLITIPPITAENDNSYSTLKMIKTCLENTMFKEKLNALTMINIENEMISNDIDFNKKVINMFSEKKGRCLDFKHKIK